jgi:hypothetical protein
MQLTFRTLVILLFVTILIMAYCSTPVDAGVVSRLTHRRRVQPRHRVTRYKIKQKTKYKSKTKITRGHKRPSLLNKIKRKG